MSIRSRVGFTIFALVMFAAQWLLSDDWEWLKLTIAAAFILSFLGSLVLAARKKKSVSRPD